MSNEIIISLLKEVRDEQKDMSRIQVDMGKDLKDHMKRCDLLEVQNNKTVERVEILEEPHKLFKYAKKILLGLGGIAGASMLITKWVGMW